LRCGRRSRPLLQALAIGIGLAVAGLGGAAGLAAAGEPPSSPAPLTRSSATRSVVLDLRGRTISLLDAGAVLGRWPVAIGAGATPTPVGRFAVINKVVNPRYQSTKSGRIHPTIGANGPLGDRWLGFLQSGPNQFGIHGTPAAWSWTVTSRAAVTNGCVRMLRAHVHQLFDQVEVGTPVIVTR
jgi:lipoprotein-anchoring transpeptidase ErfK/SrfK